LFILIGLAGCGGRVEPQPVNVEGEVRFGDGQPVPEMLLLFHPQEAANRNDRPSPFIKGDGQFKISCLPGKYKITIMPIPGTKPGGSGTAQPPDKTALTKELFPGDGIYRDVANTPWVVDVPKRGRNDLVLIMAKE
jgi:hypothetical protein